MMTVVCSLIGTRLLLLFLRFYGIIFIIKSYPLKAMSAQFCVGLLFSGATSFLILEKLRDRRLLCEKKFDEKELNDYVYRMVGYGYLIWIII